MINKKRFCSFLTGITFAISGMLNAVSVSFAEDTVQTEKTGLFIEADTTYDFAETDIQETQPVQTTTVADEITIDSKQTSSEEFIDVFSVYNAHQEYMGTTTTEETTAETTTDVQKEVYNGIDVSRWQADIDWQSVKDSGVDFAIIRAGYGREFDQVDAKFHQNMQNADAVGMDCGIYWYSYATTPEAAVLEAEACYNTIKDYQLEYPVVFDIEDECQKYLSTATISAIIESFCSTMEEKGYYVTIYSYASFLRTMVYESTLEKYDVWVAHYGVDTPGYSGSYGMWQYTSTGSVPGIEGNVDLDYAYKNYPAIMKEYHLNRY